MKKYSVTIGIPAHNEEANIVFLLNSILKQKGDNYILEKVIVICDGTTDSTIKLVRDISKKHKKVLCHFDGKRKGKMQRLSEFYTMNKSDLLFIFDGDVVLAKPTVIEDMVKQFTDEDVLAVSGNNQPVPSKTFIGKLVNAWAHVWYEVRVRYNKGDNVHNARGCAMATRRTFSKNIHIPDKLASESQYVYFLIKQRQKKFAFAKDALVYYRKPESIHDYLLQFKRSAPESLKLTAIFGEEIKEYYKIPKLYKIKGVIASFLQQPIYMPLGGLFTLIMKYIPYNEGSMIKQGIWKTVESTKKGIEVSF